MGAAANARTAGEIVTWHAMSGAEALKRLGANGDKGLDAAEASARLQNYGPNRLPEGKKRGPLMRFLAQFNNILVYVLLAAGFTKLMLSLWVDAAIIFAVVVLNGLLGFIQEGKAEKALDSIRNMLSAEARTVRGGETRMLPADELVPGDVVLLEIGRQGSGGLAAHRCEEPAHRRSGAHWQVRAGGEEHRSGFRKRDGRRPRVYGVLRHNGRIRPRDGRRRGHGQRDGTRPHQPAARRSERARNSASAADQEIRLCNNRGHRRDQRADLRLWSLDSAHGFRRAFPGGHRHRGVADPGRTACADHDHTRHRRAAHGAAQRHHQATACSRDAGLGVAHLFGQDGHADAHGNDGDVRCHRRVRL